MSLMRWKRVLLALVVAAGLAGPAHGGLASDTPPPVARVEAVHPWVALTVDGEPSAREVVELVDALGRERLHATLFLTPAAAARATPALRAAVREGRVELGLACPRPCTNPGPQAARLSALVGEPVGYVRPLGSAPAPAVAERAYRAGLVTVLWSVGVSGNPSAVGKALARARAGDIVRLAWPTNGRLVPAVAAALRERRLVAATATELLTDTRGHLELCWHPIAVLAAPAPLDRLHPTSGPAARALWRLGPMGERVVRRLYGVRPGVSLAGRPMAGLLPAEVAARVRDLARTVDRAPVDATLDRATGAVVPDVPGRAVDVAATVERLRTARPGGRVEPVVRVVHARWRAADLARVNTVLGQCRTWISGSSGRYQNIQKGARLLDHRVVYPGEVFSTLRAIGRPTKASGWYKAPVILYGSFAEGYGGGLCQVSSTLYNAVDRAGLEIVERHHHARPVHYLPRGRDATIAWPDLDFRFRNNRRTPVAIEADVRGGALVIRIVGDAKG